MMRALAEIPKEAAAKGLTAGCYRLKTRLRTIIDTETAGEVGRMFGQIRVAELITRD